MNVLLLFATIQPESGNGVKEEKCGNLNEESVTYSGSTNGYLSVVLKTTTIDNGRAAFGGCVQRAAGSGDC
jgi:hypothetical protein